MMKFEVITLFEDIIKDYCSYSIMSRAVSQDVVSVNTINPRDFATNKHKKVDDTPYGGGAGMVLMCEPYIKAYDSIKKEENSITVMLTPQGKPYNQEIARELSTKSQIILICGHYEGYDERIRKHIEPVEISLGDFVLTGGELPALCIIDSVTRLVEGGIGKIESAHNDSFSDGLLEYPHYTRPVEYERMEVPEVLRSGNHAEIEKWRRAQQFMRTMKKRPDLWEKFLKENLSKLSKEDRKILAALEKSGFKAN